MDKLDGGRDGVGAGSAEKEAKQRAVSGFPVCVCLSWFADCRVALWNLNKYFAVIYECENVCV